MDRSQGRKLALRLEIEIVMIKVADEFDRAFAVLKKIAVDAVVAQPGLPRGRVAELALKYRLPAIAPTGRSRRWAA